MSKRPADERAIISDVSCFIRLLRSLSEGGTGFREMDGFYFLEICLDPECFILAVQAVSALSESEGPGIRLCSASRRDGIVVCRACVS